MSTFAQLQTDIQTEANDTSSGTQTFIQSRMNFWHKNVCSETNWTFLLRTSTATTTASTQSYALPVDYSILRTVKITVGNIDYFPRPIVAQTQWDSITRNTNNTIESDIVQYYFIQNGNILFYPKPATSSNTITYTYVRKPRTLTSGDFTDKTAGTASITNGAAAVSGSGTAFAVTDIGREIIFDADGYQYTVSAFTSTTAITIDRNFVGTTISGGTYRLGTVPYIPEDHTDILRFYVLSDLWRRREDFAKAREYAEMAKDMVKDLYKEDKRLYATPEVNAVSDRQILDINNYPSNLTAI